MVLTQTSLLFSDHRVKYCSMLHWIFFLAGLPGYFVQQMIVNIVHCVIIEFIFNQRFGNRASRLNDFSVSCIPSSALTGIFLMPSAFFSLALDTTYDSVSFFNRSLLRGRCSLSPTRATKKIQPRGMFHIPAFIPFDPAISRMSRLVDIASSSATL
jgi:hypothetical protein